MFYEFKKIFVKVERFYISCYVLTCIAKCLLRQVTNVHSSQQIFVHSKCLLSVKNSIKYNAASDATNLYTCAYIIYIDEHNYINDIEINFNIIELFKKVSGR